MPILSLPERQQLLADLEDIPLIGLAENRTDLLLHLPQRLVNSIERSTAARPDLEKILTACDFWAPDIETAHDYPLRGLLTNACALAPNSAVIPRLEAWLAHLPAELEVGALKWCPYPGMVPFSVENEQFFYGREAEIKQLLQGIDYYGCLLVHGPSGCGKSSLLAAGLRPRLDSQRDWQISTLRPGKSPTARLQETLGAATCQALLEHDPPAPRAPQATSHLLIVDQLEEIFTQAPLEEQKTFLTQLEQIGQWPEWAVVMTLRQDFLHEDFLRLWDISPAQCLELRVLRGNALKAAITEPAKTVGITIENDLFVQLREDVADEEGSLPLLQETLVALWKQLWGPERSLSLEMYRRLGDGEQSGLAVAATRKANEILGQFTPAQRTIARRIFLRLVEFSRKSPTRRQQTVAELRAGNNDPVLFDQTLAALIDQRLLTASGDETGDHKVIDLAHEILISAWPALASWAADRRAAEQQRRRLEDKAVEWVRHGRGRSRLLDREQLQEAIQWLATPVAEELGSSLDLAALIQSSRLQIAADERRARRTRLVLAGLTLLVLAVGAFGLIQTRAATTNQASAVAAQATADARRRITRAQTLADAAADQLDKDPELSLLLATEAVSTTQRIGEPPFPKAVEMLHQAFAHYLVDVTLPGVKSTWSVWSPNGQSLLTAGENNTVQIWDTMTGQLRLALRGHTGTVYRAAWSRDSHYVLTASGDHTAVVWDGITGQAVLTLRGHSGAVYDAMWSPDQSTILTASEDQTARVWDVSSGEVLVTLLGHRGRVTSAVWSADGRTIITVSDDHTARIWDVIARQTRFTLPIRPNSAARPAWSPEGRYVLTANEDGSVTVWDAATGQQHLLLKDPDPTGLESGPLYIAAWRPDGRRILLVGNGVQVWDTTTGQKLNTLPLPPEFDSVSDAEWSPDGNYVAVTYKDGTAAIWDVLGGTPLLTLRGHSGAVIGAAWSPDGRRLATTAADGTAKIWETQGGQEYPTIQGPVKRTTDVFQAEWSPDGRSILTFHNDAIARVWDATTGLLRGTLQSQSRITSQTSWSADGSRILTRDKNDKVTVWDLGSGQALLSVPGEAADWSPDGQRILTTDGVSTVTVWDVANGQARFTLRTPQMLIDSAVWSPDGHSILTISRNQQEYMMKVWDATIGQERFVGHNLNITAVNSAHNGVWSPDGQSILIVSLDKTVTIWNAISGQERLRLISFNSYVKDVAWSGDGQRIATINDDQTLRLWDAATGHALLTLHSQSSYPRRVIWSPDGVQLATQNADGTVRIWDTAPGQELLTLPVQNDLLYNVLWSPDGRHLLVLDRGVVRQYVINIADLLTLAQARAPRALTPTERAAYIDNIAERTPVRPSPTGAP